MTVPGQCHTTAAAVNQEMSENSSNKTMLQISFGREIVIKKADPPFSSRF